MRKQTTKSKGDKRKDMKKVGQGQRTGKLELGGLGSGVRRVARG